ncbi:hypothetical protein GZH49_39925 [Nocardia terpenica]|uniref:hypothetical protein n=1 Tax=Nocardia terpenica TaxID=455432 RepID=UPI002FE0C187
MEREDQRGMSKYTVVIAADESSDVVDRQPRLTIHVDTGKPGPRITGMTITSGDPGGLTSTNLPRINLTAVIEALASRLAPKASQPQLPLFDSEPAAPAVAERAAANFPDTDMPPVSSGSVDSGQDRAYRKMPDPDELRRNLERIGTVTGLAKHYSVPRHTAQGWVTRLRKLDNAAPRGSAS